MQGRPFLQKGPPLHSPQKFLNYVVLALMRLPAGRE
jgi:hypothetical protein